MTFAPALLNADSGFTWEEINLLSEVDRCLAQGIAIRDWWRWADATGAITDRFELTQVFNRPDESYSFFATVPFPSGPLPVMGDVPWFFYDQCKGREIDKWNAEAREFVLRYFMRVSSFRLPQTVVADGSPTPPYPLDLLSWCPRGFVTREGFGYRQLYYKLRGSGEIGRFSEAESYAIVDQREMATKYEWVVANVDIFNFVLSFPLDPDLPRFGLPLSQSQYIILSDAFVVDETDPVPGLRGRYQFGYAMLRPRHDDSVLAYGPGQFEAGFQLFTFTVEDNGVIRVRMPFVVNRPTRILDISLDPIDWGFKAAEILTCGRWSFLEPLHAAFDSLPWRPGGFDPVFTGIDLLNLFTLGQASRQLCISKDQLEKFFLVFHFDQYYTMITGSLLTWRQIPDWQNPATIPLWVKTGRSS
ncbi:MAG TPA: hypothetical protein VIA62_20665 [Thermoanaerobaculia bacterium]|jgi:hypothetical protein|nr:hypothetical protein [Thermoanaerobaculia bacterium]